MRNLYLLCFSLLTSFEIIHAQECVSLGCSDAYTITTDGSQPDQGSGPEWGAYNGYPRKQTIWQYFYADAGGSYTQSFTSAADLDWLIFDMGTSFAPLNCPVSPAGWTQVGADISYNPGGPTGPGIESGVTTTAGHYYAVALILWEPLNLTFTFSTPQIAGHNLSAANCLTILPVKLLNFTAINQDGDAILHWTVGQQVNVSRYIIEGSSDGKHFQTGGTLYDSNKDAYQFFYANAIAAGIQYFRIKIVDADGKANFSPTIKISPKNNQSLTIAGNPVNHALNITGLKQSGRIAVIDLTGKQVMQNAVASTTMSVDVTQLQAGLYLLQYTSGNQSETIKFIKQ